MTQACALQWPMLPSYRVANCPSAFRYAAAQ